MTAYYNDNDPRAAAWLRQLIADGLIPGGEVDERDIRDVIPAELAGYAQCHFFAGIGGWPYALRLAGWPDDRPVWTGSCPCQPFSQAGLREGFADIRHLWPAWFHLIEQCRPGRVYGEQVASALEWLDLVFDDLEGAGYACQAEDLCAAGVGAPHIRQRLFWMADAGGTGLEVICKQPAWEERTPPERGCAVGAAIPLDGFWRDADWLGCRDGKWRPVEPGTFPLVDWASARMGRLRGYGNAIVPQIAAEFILTHAAE